MSDYRLYTDSACDIPRALLEKWGVELVSMTYTFEDSEHVYRDDELSSGDFYAKMRQGCVAKTSAVNTETYIETFEPVLKSGEDVLYIAFSSGLSSTYRNACLAAEELTERYPDRRVEVVDSLSASAGMGAVVYLAAVMKRHGADIGEVARYIEENRLRVCHWFTVGDLTYLRRGGRISSTAAVAGKLLGIKPVLYTDNEGHLINTAKARSRKASIRALADKFGEHVSAGGSKVILIAHADCRSDADELAEILKREHRVSPHHILDIGPLIGAHSGPETLALFFISDSFSRKI
ncbi:MAG: DegV family protein [Ruminococcus sp.]|nr:DegV family protein [Ruminococcus sp.]